MNLKMQDTDGTFHDIGEASTVAVSLKSYTAATEATVLSVKIMQAALAKLEEFMRSDGISFECKREPPPNFSVEMCIFAHGYCDTCFRSVRSVARHNRRHHRGNPEARVCLIPCVRWILTPAPPVKS